MAAKTSIEWTDRTWNPVVGCSLVSSGCTNCYAMRMAGRIEAMGTAPHYAGLTQPSKAGPVWTGAVRAAPEHVLSEPLRWRKPARIFVNSMSDLFHEDLPDWVIDRVFAVMALCPQHTFQVLTKRPERMRDYLSAIEAEFHASPDDLNERFGDHCVELSGDPCASAWFEDHVNWPLPNVWLGVSIEDQTRADERIPILLDTPAAVRWISAEPLLGPLDLRRWMWPVHPRWPAPYRSPAEAIAAGAEVTYHRQMLVGAWCRFLDWVVAGGESGPDARPMHPDWARSLRDQCAAAGVPFLFKQWGSWRVTYDRDREDPDWRRCGEVERETPAGRWLNLDRGHGFHGDRVVRVTPASKSAACRLLDGVIHDAYPERRP
jgi:protein gp37